MHMEAGMRHPETFITVVMSLLLVCLTTRAAADGPLSSSADDQGVQWAQAGTATPPPLVSPSQPVLRTPAAAQPQQQSPLRRWFADVRTPRQSHAPAQDRVVPRTEGPHLPPYCDVIRGRLTVGYRLTTYTLTDDSRSSTDPYFGHVIGLEAETDVETIRGLYAEWYIGARGRTEFETELAWSHVAAATRNIEGHTDGTVSAGGPVLTASARWPIPVVIRGYEWNIAPAAGLGFAWLFADFDHAAWWHYGFGTDIRSGGSVESAIEAYEAWVDRGASRDELDYTRTISVDDCVGLVFAGSVRASRGALGVEAYLRYTHANVSGTYRQSWTSGAENALDIEFPLSNWTYGIGVSYAF
jgi:hypothetical protein